MGCSLQAVNIQYSIICYSISTACKLHTIFLRTFRPNRQRVSAVWVHCAAPQTALGRSATTQRCHQVPSTFTRDRRTKTRPTTVDDPERIHDDPERIHDDPERIHADSGRIHADPERIHAGPERIHADPGRIHADPERIHADPERIHADPDRIHADPDRIHADPDRIHADPDVQWSLPLGRRIDVAALTTNLQCRGPCSWRRRHWRASKNSRAPRRT